MRNTPIKTIWLKIGNSEYRVFKQLTSNKLNIPEPDIVQQVDGEPVKTSRVINASHWVHVGTGEALAVETVLKNAKGKPVMMAQARNVLDHYNSLALNRKGEQIDKKKIQFFILNQDGSVGDQVAPYSPTERIEIKDTPEEVSEQTDPSTAYAYWAPSSVMEPFLIHEEYELPAADPRNDMKAFRNVEAALKKDEVAVFTFSNGSFKLYYAFLVPFVKEGQFVWLMKISDKQVEYNFLRDVPAPATALRQAKILQTLPPIQHLLTVPAAKPKKK